MSGTLYTLCVFSGVGIVLNLMLLTWQAIYLKIERGYQFVKYGFLITYASQCLVGIAVVCVILYRDTGGESLCHAAGFLVLFGCQEALWFMCITTASLQLWSQRCVPRELRRRNVAIFLLVAATTTVIVMIISALPVTSLPYFDKERNYAFPCTPLRLPGEQGWAFSTLTIILCWIALSVTILPLIFKISRHRHCWNVSETSETTVHIHSITPCTQCQLYTTMCLMATGWSIILIILTAGYFSSGFDNDRLQWVLGFCVACTLIVPPIIPVVVRFIKKFIHTEDPKLNALRSLMKNTPKKLETIHKLNPRDQDQVRIDTHKHIFTDTHLQTHTTTPKHTHTYIYTHTHTHIYIYIYIYMALLPSK